MPPIETERLLIRPFVAGDLNEVYRIIDCDCFGSRSPDDCDAKRGRQEWLEWNILGCEQQARLGHPPYGERAVTLKGGGLVGVCGLVPSFGPFRRLLDGDASCTLNSPEVGLFYAIARDHRRQGLATEAAAALVRYAFETLQARRIVATTERTNADSIGVMRRLGMTIHSNIRAGGPEIVGCRKRDE